MHDDNTPQELGRTKATGHGHEWEVAFEAQMTREMVASLKAYAKKRAEWIQRATKRHDPYLARELYQNAVTDTWLGKSTVGERAIAWEPTKMPLELHLKRTIRSRSAAIMEHLAQFPEERVRTLNVDLETKMSAAMETNQTSDSISMSYMDEIVARLRELAGDDTEVIQIISCYTNGQTERREVMRATGLDDITYHNARRRLKRFVDQLPNDLREQAIQAMVRS